MIKVMLTILALVIACLLAATLYPTDPAPIVVPAHQSATIPYGWIIQFKPDFSNGEFTDFPAANVKIESSVNFTLTSEFGFPQYGAEVAGTPEKPFVRSLALPQPSEWVLSARSTVQADVGFTAYAVPRKMSVGEYLLSSFCMIVVGVLLSAILAAKF